MFWDSIMVFMHGHLSFERLGSNFLITCSGCLVLFLFVCFFPSCPLLFLDGLQFRGDALATTSQGTPCLLNFLPDLNASMAAGSSSSLALTFYFVFLFPPSAPATQFNNLFCLILSCILGICVVFMDDTLRLCLLF